MKHLAGFPVHPRWLASCLLDTPVLLVAKESGRVHKEAILWWGVEISVSEEVVTIARISKT